MLPELANQICVARTLQPRGSKGTHRGPQATTKAQRGGQANEQAMEPLVTRSLDIHQTIYSRCYRAESYSQSILPRATPGLVCRELLPSCRAESSSRAVVPRATPEMLCREILPVYRADTCANNALDELPSTRAMRALRFQSKLTRPSQKRLISAKLYCSPKHPCWTSRKPEASNCKRHLFGRQRLRDPRDALKHSLLLFCSVCSLSLSISLSLSLSLSRW